jgi:hypothetical protein
MYPFRSMVREGIPHSLRPYIWLRLAGAMQKKTSSEIAYKQVNTYTMPIRSPSLWPAHLWPADPKIWVNGQNAHLTGAVVVKTNMPILPFKWSDTGRIYIKGYPILYPKISKKDISYPFLEQDILRI